LTAVVGVNGQFVGQVSTEAEAEALAAEWRATPPCGA